MLFHENRLLADDSHEIYYLIFFEISKDVAKFVVCCSRDGHFKELFIRIYQECDSGIETSILQHHEACRVMTDGDFEERTFLSHTYSNDWLFALLKKGSNTLGWDVT